MQYNMVYYCKFIQSSHEREELFFVEFSVNSPVLFVIAGLIIAAVLAQSVYFLIKAWKRGLAIGMGKEKLRRIARTAAVFTIAPAVAIVISVITGCKPSTAVRAEGLMPYREMPARTMSQCIAGKLEMAALFAM